MSDVMICQRSARVVVDGAQHHIRRNATTAHADSAIVKQYPELWTELVVDFPAASDADVPTAPGPSAKDVRAWARGQGIDVPARGKLPIDLISQYEAAENQAARDE